MKSFEDYDRIYSVVISIPRGQVATYGQIAELAGLPGHARQVGYALKVIPDDRAVPWHRVVNARGEISPRGTGDCEREQRLLLEAEGVTFEPGNRLALSKYQWKTW
jgi:methylated-DNA-protein-cysteine methyltransferase-like protein